MKITRSLQSLLFIAIATVFVFCQVSCDDNDDKQAVPGSGDYDLNEPALKAEGYTKVFEDNFNVNLDLWDTWIGGAYNNELQYYQASNLEVSDGILKISAKKETVEGMSTPGSGELKTFAYTSGRIESNFELAPTAAAGKVRISARIKLPAGYGMWPAFWSYGNPWPTQGEIDILEALGDDTHTFTTDYFYGPQESTVVTDDELTVATITSNTDLSAAYHVYEVIWSQTSLVFLLDGHIIDSKLASSPGNSQIPSFFGKLQHIALNMAVGGDIFPDFDPAKIQTATMYVDWVKVFTAK